MQCSMNEQRLQEGILLLFLSLLPSSGEAEKALPKLFTSVCIHSYLSCAFAMHTE